VDIEAAGKSIVNQHGGTSHLSNGDILFGNYKGVRVGVILNSKYQSGSNVGTIFPDNSKQPLPGNHDFLEKNPH
jgi:hypothetical protein